MLEAAICTRSPVSYDCVVGAGEHRSEFSEEPAVFHANYPSGQLLTEDEIRARIYQVSCNSCGWRGDACGLSAIHISHPTELKARIVGQVN